MPSKVKMADPNELARALKVGEDFAKAFPDLREPKEKIIGKFPLKKEEENWVQKLKKNVQAYFKSNKPKSNKSLGTKKVEDEATAHNALTPEEIAKFRTKGVK